jgi:uncharacterized membrane protein
MAIEELVDVVGRGVDGAGVALIVGGLVAATVRFLTRLWAGGAGAYQAYREDLGRTLLLGLEVLVAADMIRTVALAPTVRRVGILARMVLIRTLRSWTLALELERRWPWQHPRQAAAPPPLRSHAAARSKGAYARPE